MPNFKISGFLEVYILIGAVVGSLLAVISTPRFLFLLCGSVFFISGVVLWVRRTVSWEPLGHQDAYSRRLGWEGVYYDEAEGRTIVYRASRASLAGPLMGIAGLISGWVGIGGSALAVLIQNVVMGLPPKVSLTTSSLIIGVMSLASANVCLEAGLIDAHLVIPTILGVALGAVVGSRLVTKLTNQITRTILIWMLVILGIELILRGALKTV